MVEPRFVELIHAEVDGVIADDDRAQLYDYIASNPEAGRQLQDLQRLAQELDEVGLVDPPDALRWELRRAIPEGRPRPFWAGLGGSLSPVWKYGLAAAAGAALALLAAPWTGGPELDPEALQGTLSGAGASQTLVIEQGALRGTVEVGPAAPGRIPMEFQLESTEPVALELQFFNSGIVIHSETLQIPEHGSKQGTNHQPNP